ncbi:MAG TPA: sialidase family protein [Candidatus Acidoferrales bacterium]|nr:sialidase family protein [Candidatus Acidoferrales bacterium]
MTRTRIVLALLVANAVLSGCGGSGTPPPPPPPISVTFPGGNAQTVQQGQSLTINAVVNNDSSAKGVTWTLGGDGSLSKQASTSVEYDAPASVVSNVAATITATSVADPTKSAVFNATVTYPPVALVKLSADKYSGGLGQHATEVEPDTFAFGSTIVSTFQVSRIFGGAAMDVGFATSTDGGATWASGVLPGITTSEGGGFDADGDPVVAYDAARGEWIIATIAVHDDASGNPLTEQIVVSRSPDGFNWGNPVAVNPEGVYDKDWIVCDDTSGSPFFGHCYVQWVAPKGFLNLSTSTDGGATWAAPLLTADSIKGGGTQPVVQANGTVIIPMLKQLSTDMLSFVSTDGGASWSSTTELSNVTDHEEAGNLRSVPLASAEIDGAGNVYVAWQDCRYRTNCASNDIVLSTSSNGINWTSPARVPIDPVDSTVDHFLPGLAVDRSTSGASAHLTLLYYYYPVSACGANCDLYVGFVSSRDGGQTWTAPVVLAGPMKLSWLAQTGSNVTPGAMVGDYFSTSYVNGNPFGVFAVAKANSGSTFDEAMYTTGQPMLTPANAARFSSKGDRPVPHARSDHPPRDLYPEPHRVPPGPIARLSRRNSQHYIPVR